MRTTTVSIQEIARHGRMDPEFFIDLHERQRQARAQAIADFSARAEQLETALGRDRILEIIGTIDDEIYKFGILVLAEKSVPTVPVPTGQGRPPIPDGEKQTISAQIDDLCLAHPGLALAIIEADRDSSARRITQHASAVVSRAQASIRTAKSALDALPPAHEPDRNQPEDGAADTPSP